MEPLSSTDRDHFAQRLEQLRQQVDEHLESLQRSVAEGGDEHPGSGVSHSRRSVDRRLMERERRTQAEIDAALERVRSGTFGVCVACGTAIDRGRLDVVPQTSRCTNCARELAARDGALDG